ncbi:MAG: hypothetical protein VKP57_10495 [Candidatus Sericytochromatia bacterium]|nr:hypothetical protein [Candidatus Sericytochromatia bacterium]
MNTERTLLAATTLLVTACTIPEAFLAARPATAVNTDEAGRKVVEASPQPDGTPQAIQPENLGYLVMNGLARTLERVAPGGSEVTRLFETGLYPNQLVRIGSNLLTVESGDATLAVGPADGARVARRISLEVGFNPMEVIGTRPDEVLVTSVVRKQALLVRLSDGTTLRTLDLPDGHQSQGGVTRLDNRLYLAAADVTYDADWNATTTWSGIHVYDIDTGAFLAPIVLPTDETPWAIATLPGKKIVVGTQSGATIIDPANGNVVARIDAKARLASFATDGDGKAWAGLGAATDGSSQGRGLIRFDPASGTVLKDSRRDWTIDTGDSSASRLAIEGNVAWLPNFAEDKVTTLDLAKGSVIRRTNVGDGPQMVLPEPQDAGE